MTIGFPDYGRQAHTTGVVQSTVSQVITTQYTGPVIYAADYGYIDLSWNTNGLADYYIVGLFFYDDINGLTQPSHRQITVGPVMYGGMQFPCPGQYVQVVINAVNGTDVNPFKLFLRATNSEHPSPWNSELAVPLARFDSTIGAGATQTLTLPDLWPGDAYLSVHHATNNSWTFEQRYYDTASKSFLRYATLDGVTYGQGFNGIVALPAAPVQLDMINNDTSARACTVGLIPIIR